MNIGLNCLTYARVFTDKQAEKELSIPAQLQAMRRYADERVWRAIRRAGRLRAHGKPPDAAADVSRAREGIDDVLVHKIDGFARNVADQAMIQIVLKRCGVRLASVVENLDGWRRHRSSTSWPRSPSSTRPTLRGDKEGKAQKVLQGRMAAPALRTTISTGSVARRSPGEFLREHCSEIVGAERSSSSSRSFNVYEMTGDGIIDFELTPTIAPSGSEPPANSTLEGFRLQEHSPRTT